MAGLTAVQQAFIDRYAPYANLASQQTGLPARVILAKLGLESNYGQNMYGNNIAGLKTGAAAQNQGSIGSGNVGTFEDLAGGRTQIRDNFLRYNSPEEGFGGFVNWINNSGVPGINVLGDRAGGGLFAPDDAIDQAAINALNNSPYSTDKNLPVTLPQRLSLIPDLTGYGVASSFSPAINQLDQMVPPSNPATDFSQGLGPITTNDYSTGTEYQPQGRVLGREKNAFGLELPSPQMGPVGTPSSPFDAFSDAITGGLNAAGSAFGQGVGAVANGAGDLFNGVFGDGSAQAAAFNPDTSPFAFGGAFPAYNAFGGGFGRFNAGFPTMAFPANLYGPQTQIQTPADLSGNFDSPQAQGVDPGNPFGNVPQFGLPAGFGFNPTINGVPVGNPFGQPPALATDPNFGAPDLAGVDPNAGFNPGQFFGGGLGAFGGGFGGFNPFGGQGGFNPTINGLPVQQISPFGAPGAFGTNPFDGTDAATLGPDGTAATQGPDAAADPFGFNGSFASPFGAPAAFNPFGGGFGAFNASPFGPGFGAFNAPTLGFDGTNAPTLGPDQFATATDQAPAPDPFGFGAPGIGGGLGAMPQGFGGGFGGFNPFGGGFNPTVNGVSVGGIGGFGNPFGGFDPGGFGGIGAQGFGDIYGVPAAPAPAPAAPGPFDFGGNDFGGGLGAGAQSFGGLYGVGAPAAPAPSPFGFGNAGIGGGLGAQAQSFGLGGFGGFGGGAFGGGGFNPFGGSGFNPGGFGDLGSPGFGDLYGVGAPAAPAPSPFGFSGADVSGFDPNAGAAPAEAAPPADGGAGASADFGGSGFDSAGSERAFLAMQARQIAAQQAAGQAPVANDPNLWNQQLFAMTPPAPAPVSFIPQAPAFAGVPTSPGFSQPGFSAPAPILPQINIPNFSAAGIGNIGFGSLGIR